jgi:signal transduction histidine kinase
LRTPLNAVLGFGQLLERELTDPRALRWVSQIEQAGRHVLAQVEELLDLASAESGHLSVKMTWIDVDPLVSGVIELVGPLAQERDITLTAAPSGLRVEADADRLRVVMLNLVSNAIKYNSPGGMVSVSAGQQGSDTVEISVADDGPGIPDAQLERAFAMFERLDAVGRGVPGAGLGLAIAREYARAMNGTLAGRARNGGGVEMTVQLRGGALPGPASPETWVLYV